MTIINSLIRVCCFFRLCNTLNVLYTYCFVQIRLPLFAGDAPVIGYSPIILRYNHERGFSSTKLKFFLKHFFFSELDHVFTDPAELMGIGCKSYQTRKQP